MTVCPVALAVGCRRCPAFSFCPATRILGDQTDSEPSKPAAAGKKSAGKKKS